MLSSPSPPSSSRTTKHHRHLHSTTKRVRVVLLKTNRGAWVGRAPRKGALGFATAARGAVGLAESTKEGALGLKPPQQFNRLIFQKRTKDMLSSKWNTLNHNCQKFNAIYKRCSGLTKIGESELDVMKPARAAYRDENKNSMFAQEDAWEILRKHAKWDAPARAPVDLTEDEEIAEVNTDELFDADARPRPPDKQRPGKKRNHCKLNNGL
ncbi:hypothetical protein Tco_0418135 [Tanacetum coccineum]